MIFLHNQKKLENAIKDILKTALVYDGLVRGLREAVKTMLGHTYLILLYCMLRGQKFIATNNGWG